MVFDVVICGADIVDGNGGHRLRADLGIIGDHIEAVGVLNQVEAVRRVDADGHIVAPGFIDMHSHSDVSMLDDPGGESKAYQGVTTEVTGNCSYSPFPTGRASPKILQQTLGRTLRSREKWNWTTLDGWAEALSSNGTSLNIVPQVGNGALRIAVGAVEDRPATSDELSYMQQLAAEAVEQGAFSVSTGLSLSPSGYATTDEVVALCKAISSYRGAFYVTHARVLPGWHVKMIEEAVEIGRRAEIPVQFSHMAIIDHRYHGQGEELVEVIERAREQGVDITYDVYPYTAAGAGLNQLVPLWAQEGGLQTYMACLQDPETRRRVRDEMVQGRAGGIPPQWENWIISQIASEINNGLVGCSLIQIAEDRSVDPAEATLQLIEEEEDAVSAVVHNREESDVRFFLGHPQAMIGSDGTAVSPDGLYASEQPHPRFYGTYPRILGRYVREEPSVMTLETAIFKMTGFPAQRLGLPDRGRIAEGYKADLVIFDPETVIDNATFDVPQQYPNGIPHVFVNGEAIISDGQHTGARPGRVLRRGS